MTRTLEVGVEPTCISSGYCRNRAPDVFGALPTRRAYVLRNPVSESPEVQEAMESCPVEAIWAKDAETGEDVFP